ncbi:alpha/beta fold hydrolase [Bordetella holmesii]|uniref:Alpha/beta hydrolase family protein n=2 Tax=Bordetella holmesii TaxID=35814 RepID=A0A158M3Q8_9BORD|nr:alpha/beta fold hydrolase [Bordetella holmesii]AHV94330.1 alpha/beta hydrolase fold family protein [Bordetella holmesii ATCC 51541]AIT25591.1 alpha/beta hydrolase fold family protein [Bordetella holmesii 44057]AMD44750.1 alpha/beta hydrolase [Bordetella holmesii H558]AOB36849.1 alpha/beta hydrolase [Bordetella holmesii]AUL20803.1 alpha/beta hydrolase [Bordetella holmesii]
MLTTQDHFIETDHGRLFARRWHAGETGLPPVVLLHDSLGCVALWRDFPARLAQAAGRDVIAYDRLGFGCSDAHPGRLDLDFVSQEAESGLRCVREQLEIGPFVAMGHSVGGGMAIVAAGRYAHDCWGLITESAQVFAESRTLSGIRQAREDFALPGQLDRLKKYHGDKAAWVLSAWVDSWLSPDFVQWNLDTALAEVRCTVLALHGDSDEYGSLIHAERIAGQTGGQKKVFAQCGHVPHREQPEAVLAVIGAWLA